MTVQILIAVSIRFLIYFVHWMVLAYLPVLFSLYGFSDVEIGVTIGIYSLSSMLLMLPMGIFSDYFSPKRILLSGALLFVVYFISLLFLRSFAQLIPAVIIGGIGAASLIVVSEALFLKIFGHKDRGKRIGIYQVATYLGFGLGPLTGGYLLQHHPQFIFYLAAAGSVLIFLIGLFSRDFEPIVFSFRQYGEDLVRFKPLLLMACIFVLGTHFGIEQTSFSLLLKKKLDFTTIMIGYVFAGLGLWMALAAPIIGRLHDKRTSVFLFFLGGLGVSGIFQVLTAWAHDFTSLLIIRIIHTLGDAVALLELSVLVAMFFPAHRLGGNSGLLFAIRTLATFLAAVLAGSVNKIWGYGASFIGNGVFVIAFVLLTVLFVMSRDDLRLSVGWHLLKRQKAGDR